MITHTYSWKAKVLHEVRGIRKWPESLGFSPLLPHGMIISTCERSGGHGVTGAERAHFAQRQLSRSARRFRDPPFQIARKRLLDRGSHRTLESVPTLDLLRPVQGPLDSELSAASTHATDYQMSPGFSAALQSRWQPSTRVRKKVATTGEKATRPAATGHNSSRATSELSRWHRGPSTPTTDNLVFQVRASIAHDAYWIGTLARLDDLEAALRPLPSDREILPEAPYSCLTSVK